MKKIYFTLAILLATGVFAMAQKTANSPVSVGNAGHIGLSAKTTVVDTLLPESASDPCFANWVLYSSTNGGFVVGNNGYEDVAKAQKFYTYGATATVSEILVYFGAKTEALATSPLGASLMSVGANGGPNSVIMASTPITMADVDTTGALTSFPFATPVSVADSFFCNIILPTTAGDTVGIVSTADPCSMGFHLWEEWSGGLGWFAVADSNAWGIMIDAIILPVVDIIASTPEGFVQSRGLKLYGNYPNPAANNTTISFENEQPSAVALSIVGINGQVLKTIDFGNVAPGRHDINLDVTDLAAGMYTYVLSTTSGRLAARFSVAK